jgi:soluble lytic murein transglycosylase-like protein
MRYLKDVIKAIMCLLIMVKMANASIYQDVSNASRKYSISPKIFWAIMKVESEYKKRIHNNPNGSFDVGVMQINSLWIKSLANKGFKVDLLNDSNNINIAGYILKENMNKGYGLWQSIGLYHSSNKRLRAVYIKRVKRALNEQRYYLD